MSFQADVNIELDPVWASQNLKPTFLMDLGFQKNDADFPIQTPVLMTFSSFFFFLFFLVKRIELKISICWIHNTFNIFHDYLLTRVRSCNWWLDSKAGTRQPWNTSKSTDSSGKFNELRLYQALVVNYWIY